jgi:hypothetical protein
MIQRIIFLVSGNSTRSSAHFLLLHSMNTAKNINKNFPGMFLKGSAIILVVTATYTSKNQITGDESLQILYELSHS